MVEMMRDLATYSGEQRSYQLLRERDEVRTVALVAMTGDRGLAGAFNANVVRSGRWRPSAACARRGARRALVVVGKKGIGTLRFRGCRAGAHAGRV